MNILVIEDDPRILSLYEQWLLASVPPGSFVSFAPTGERAQFMLDRAQYDLTFLDLAIPEINGYDLYKRFKDRMGSVVLASILGDVYKDRMGIPDSHILRKPFSESDLYKKIEQECHRDHDSKFGREMPKDKVI